MQTSVFRIDKTTNNLLGKIAACERRKKIDEIRVLVEERAERLGISLD